MPILHIKFMDKKNYNILGIIVWWIFAILIGLTIYVRFLPHGPMLNMGEDCFETNDGRTTTCGDRYVEDTRRLNIPEWAKFIRGDSRFILFLIGLPILAMYLQTKGGKEFR